MNELKIEKIREQAEEIGFVDSQDKLVEECRALIEAAEGEDYDAFIEKLADVRVILEQVRLTLDDYQQEQYEENINNKLGIQTDTDEEVPDDEEFDIDPDNEPF